MIELQQLIKKISIHPLLWALFAIGLFTGHFKEVVMVFLIVFIHEMGHACTAHFFHWRIKKIELLPFGGVAEVDEHGNRPIKEEFLVIISGPLQHIWIAGVATLFVQFEIISTFSYEHFMIHNMLILLFNLLPIWPLDGGKLLFLLFTSRFPFQYGLKLSLMVSFLFLFVMIVLSLFIFSFHLNLWIVILFLLVSHYYEWRQRHFTHIRFLLERYYGKQNNIQKLKPIRVVEDETIFQVISRFSRGCKHQILLNKGNTSFDENELLYAYFTEKRTTSKIGELIG